MKILLIHNRYVHEGGEDMVFNTTADLLKSRGHRVLRYVRDNRRLTGSGRWRMAVTAHWSPGSMERLSALINREKPDVAHFHNIFPLISPSAYHACRTAGVPIVQTLHNYRLICPGALLMRNGRPCEDCIGRTLPWPGVLHACYRESFFQSAAAASMLVFHRLLSTWKRQVDTFIALSPFARKALVKGGLPEARITVRPNFIHPDPGRGRGPGGYAVYAGRLSREKGIEILLEAWRLLPNVPLYIVGDGPLMGLVRTFSASRSGAEVRVLGGRTRREVFTLMQGARMIVFPSQCPEPSSLAALESFACGRPVVAWNMGAVGEIVDHGRTGLLCRPGDPDEFARAVMTLWMAPEDAERMGANARAEFEAKYSAETYYRGLLEIYTRAIASRQGGCR